MSWSKTAQESNKSVGLDERAAEMGKGIEKSIESFEVTVGAQRMQRGAIATKSEDISHRDL